MSRAQDGVILNANSCSPIRGDTDAARYAVVRREGEKDASHCPRRLSGHHFFNLILNLDDISRTGTTTSSFHKDGRC